MKFSSCFLMHFFKYFFILRTNGIPEQEMMIISFRSDGQVFFCYCCFFFFVFKHEDAV